MIWIVLLLTAVWVAMSQDLTLQNGVAGFAISVGLVLLGGRSVTISGGSLRRLPSALALLLYLLYELVVSNLRVASLVLRPRVDLHPGIVAVPLDLEHEWQVALLANLVTLTPGSLTVEVSRDRKTLFVHDLVVGDPEVVRREIKAGFERRIRRLAP